MVALPESNPSPTPATASHDPTDRFNWRTCWYPIAFSVDLPVDRPYGFTIFAEPFVLFRDRAGELVCLRDRCPHRLVKLSDGKCTDGKLECLYHGWQFGQQGTCLHIPHLLDGAEIPERANVPSFPVREEQGMVWVWADEAALPADQLPPTVSELDSAGVFKVDTMTDFPFDYAVLIENMLDPAHVYISHDRTELKIRKEDAAPLSMEVLETSITGFRGRYRRANQPQAPWTALTFHAPTLVNYSFSNPAYGVVGGFALYALPLAYGRSRILARRYGNFFQRSFTLKPLWLEHLRQSKIFEQDLPLIAEQDRFFQCTDQPLKSAYFPLKTSDTFVMEQRRWLDRFAQDWPWYVGSATARMPTEVLSDSSPPLATRLERHTQHCHTCRSTHKRLSQLIQGGRISAIATLAITLLTDDWLQILFVFAFVTSTVTVAAAERLKRHFEVSSFASFEA